MWKMKKMQIIPTIPDENWVDIIADYPEAFQYAFIEWAEMRRCNGWPELDSIKVKKRLDEINRLTSYLGDDEERLKAQIDIMNLATDNNFKWFDPLF